MKSAEKPQKTEVTPQDSFKPFDYSQSDLKVFAGTHIIFLLHWVKPRLIFHSFAVVLKSKKKKQFKFCALSFLLQVTHQRITHSLIQTGKPTILREKYGSVKIIY